jgi:hypothetical protein
MGIKQFEEIEAESYLCRGIGDHLNIREIVSTTVTEGPMG